MAALGDGGAVTCTCYLCIGAGPLLSAPQMQLVCLGCAQGANGAVTQQNGATNGHKAAAANGSSAEQGHKLEAADAKELQRQAQEVASRGWEGWGSPGTVPKFTARPFRVLGPTTQASERCGALCCPGRLQLASQWRACAQLQGWSSYGCSWSGTAPATLVGGMLSARLPAAVPLLPRHSKPCTACIPFTARAVPVPQFFHFAYLVWRALRSLRPSWGYFYSIPFWLAEYAAFVLSNCFILSLWSMVRVWPAAASSCKCSAAGWWWWCSVHLMGHGSSWS